MTDYTPHPLPKRNRAPRWKVTKGGQQVGGTFVSYEKAKAYIRLLRTDSTAHLWAVEIVKPLNEV
jgi:hypothetical protein